MVRTDGSRSVASEIDDRHLPETHTYFPPSQLRQHSRSLATAVAIALVVGIALGPVQARLRLGR